MLSKKKLSYKKVIKTNEDIKSKKKINPTPQ